MGIQDDLARQYISMYPDAATQTIARILYADNPTVYNSLETARAHVRYARGAYGQRNRNRSADKNLFRKPQMPGNPFGTLPDPIKDLSEAEPIAVDSGTVLILSDVHVPYHNRAALETALEYGHGHGVNTVILNGDILDCHSVSRFVTDPRDRDFPREVEETQKVLKVIRDGFGPDVRIIYKWGNHEERYYAYMFLKAPEIFGIRDQFALERILNLDELNIEWADRRKYIRVGKLAVVHGHEFGGGSYTPVNPARTIYNKAKTTCVAGHWHRSSAHTESDMLRKTVSTWSIGCLCQLSPDYSVYNNWNHGLAIVTFDEDDFVFRNLRLIKGRVM